MKKLYWKLFSVGVILISAIASLWFWNRYSQTQDGPDALPVLSTLGPFTLQNQEGQPFTLDQMTDGSVHVVNFIFTTCPGVCPLLTEQMKVIEKNTRKYNDKVKFLSVSVDPETDTPPVLKRYAEKHEVDLARWNFVTGPLEAVQKTVIIGFQTAMGKTRKVSSEEGAPTLFEIAHGEHFVIVDSIGRIRAYRTVKNEQELADILKIIDQLINA